MPAIFAEFASPEGILRAAARLRALGYTRLDSFTPFPCPELEEELGVRRSRIPRGVLACAFAGLGTAFLIIWFCNAYDYPLNVGGRPLNSFVADIPIMFETTVLFSGGGAFLAALLSNRLPRLHDHVSEVPGIERASASGFFLRVDAADPRFDSQVVHELEDLGAVATQEVDRP
jgi:hypothetical protein